MTTLPLSGDGAHATKDLRGQRPAGTRADAAHGMPVESTTVTGDNPAQTASHALPALGEHVQHYEIIRELGHGGMGAVYLSRDTKLGRRVAVKFLRSMSRSVTERFLAEARATAVCHHENIVVIHELGEHRGNPFMVLEYLRGQTLRGLMDGHPMPPHRAVQLVVPVVRALECAHRHGIVHRDLKPENIFVTHAGAIKVLDFGIAKVLQSHEEDLETSFAEDAAAAALPLDITRTQAIVGTVPYMSPEQWNRTGIDHRSDFWAVGIILHELVTGHHPLAPLTRDRVLLTPLLDVPMPSVLSAGVEIPVELAQIIDRCLAKDKSKRFASARELLSALEVMLPHRRGRASGEGSSPYPGLFSFQEADAERYFGRSRDVAALIARLGTQPLVGVIGPTGVGKSSFLRAGVIPALRASGESWEVFLVRPGRYPLDALASAFLPLLAATQELREPGESGSGKAALAQRLRAEPGYLGTLLRERAQRTQSKILVVVDPMEELYTLTSSGAEQQAFTACISAMADDAAAPLRAVISMRSDFLDRVAEDRAFMAELAPGIMFLLPPDRAGLEEALTMPAEMAGIRFESREMIDAILDAVEATPGSLPLLQFAAAKLWEGRDRERRLFTMESYRAIGGIEGALTSHADQVIATVSRLGGRALPLTRAIFERLVTPDRTRAVTLLRDVRALDNDGELTGRIIAHLVDARLLVIQGGQGAPGSGAPSEEGQGATIELVHDSLIHNWPRLRRWLDDSEDSAAFIQELSHMARQWTARGRPQGLLWRGEAVDEARRFVQRYSGMLAPAEEEYLQAAFTLESRAARRKRLAIISGFALLVSLVVGAGIGLVTIREAEQEARAAERTVREQLEVIRARESERDRAQAQAESARSEASDASRQVALSREELAAANASLERKVSELEETTRVARTNAEAAEQARREAERAQARAEAEAERARKAALLAQEAQASEAKARAEAQRLLEKETSRRELLERKLGSLGSDTLK